MKYAKEFVLGLSAGASAMAASPAFAQGVSAAGANIDVQAGAQTILGIFLALVGLALVAAGGVQGVRAVMEGRHIAGAAGAVVGGILIAFSGYYVMTKIGISTAGL